MRQTFHDRLMGKGGTGLLLCLVALFVVTHVCQARTQPLQRMVPPSLTTPNMPLAPYLDYFLDKSGEMDEKEVTSAENAQAFRQFDLKNMPYETGAVWLRFILSPLSDGAPASVIFLDLGESMPGSPAFKRNISPLPEAEKNAKTCLVRLDGMPGPWFQPMLRTPEDIANNPERLARSAGVFSLAVVMLLCILRCLTERGQWRFWTAIYVGMALLQGFLGQPATGHGRIETGDVAAALAPGLALLLLSHVGRHLTGARSRTLNIQFFLLSLPGAALALLPLLPDFSWTTRYSDLWPLGTLLYVPSAMGAVMMGIPRTGRFLLGCLLPPLFTAAGLLLAGGDIPAGLLASAPLWGIVLSAMVIATTSISADEAGHMAAADEAGRMAAAEVYDLEEPLGDSNLRIIPAVQPPDEQTGTQAAASPELPPTLVEDAVRIPLEDLMRAGAALEHCALPPAVRQYVANMLDAARSVTNIISNPLSKLQTPANKTSGIFNLQHLMRNAHDSVAPMAKTSGIGLAWYMPPHLGHMYEGEAENLEQTVRLLLESAVRATRHGAVQFSVTRVPESMNAGHLLFTVKDTGSGMPPHNRSSLALTRAWELVGSNNGFLGMECSPQGTTVAFTLHLKCREDEVQENEQTSVPHVIIVAESAVDRQLLSHMLKSLPCKSSEARSLHEALLLHKENPALLLVLHGRFTYSPASLLQQFTSAALVDSLPFCKFLGITRDDSRWDVMAQEGFTHALAEPVDSESFCMTVRGILDALPHKGAAAEDDARTAAEPERPNSAAGPQESGMPADDATMRALSGPEDEHHSSGRPAERDTFAADAMSASITQIKIPDITALPDLLSFAESLLDSAKNPMDKHAQITPADDFGGLFGSVPQQPLDMHSPDSKDAAPPETDNGLSGPFATHQKISREKPLAESEIPPAPAQNGNPARSEEDGTRDAPAISDNSAANATPPPMEEAMGDNKVPYPRPKHARRKFPHRKSSPVPSTPPRDISDNAGPRESETSRQEAPASPPPSPQMPDSAVRRPLLNASDKSVEWVGGEPMPIPSPPKKTATAAPLRGRLEIRAVRKEKTETDSPGRSPHTPPAAPGPVKHAEDVAPAPSAKKADPAPAIAPSSEAKPQDRPFMDFIAGVSRQNPGNAPQRTDDQPAGAAESPEGELTAKPQNRRETDNTMLQLVERLDRAATDARSAFTQQRAAAVGEAAQRIAAESEDFGLRVLARMARCVERAARARDMNALRDLLPELMIAVERNRIALMPRN
ncbi:MAG: hypothetical protein LBN96_05240 [Desulfovibrio sp.]|jgi:signal transduction histidine kinase|nr:hypothetical protein [Desulfovibrio sp.]